MTVFLGADHAGFELKEEIKDFLQKLGYETEDCGAFTYDKFDDYPDFISKTAIAVSNNPGSMGVIFGGSGQAEMMVANKIKGIRCALFYGKAVAVQAVDITGRMSSDPYEMIRLSREHNNANMLSIAVRFVEENEAEKVIELWLKQKFPGEERHVRRIKKIEELER